MSHSWLVYSSLNFLLVFCIASLNISHSLCSNISIHHRLQDQTPAECQSICALTQLSTYKDQTSGPTKKEEEEKGKVMPEDEHVGQGHLNYVSLVWTILSSQMLLSDRLQVNWGTDTFLENSQIWHTALRSQFCCFYSQLRVTATLRQHCDNKHWWSSDYSV